MAALSRGLGRAAWLLALAVVLARCEGLVGLGDERTLADAGSAGAAGGDGEAGVENPNDRCSEHGQGLLWAMQFGDAATQTALSIAAGKGSFYLAGTFNGGLDLGAGLSVSAGKQDLFLARFDENGQHLWSKYFGDNNDQIGIVRVTLAPDGGAFFHGDFSGTVDFGDGAPRTALGNDGFVARYDAPGKLLWVHTISSSGSDLVNDLAVHAASSTLVVTVQVAGAAADFDGKSIPHVGAADILLAKLDLDGNQIWSLAFGESTNEMAHAVAVEADGRIAVAGQMDDAVNFGTGALPVVAWPDAFVAFFEPDGSLIWAKSFPGPGHQIPQRLAIDPTSGDLIIAGRLAQNGSTSFGGSNLFAANGGFLARLTASGDHVASRAVQNFVESRGLIVDPQGNVVVAGPFNGIVEFGEPIATEGLQDGIVAKLGPGLDPLWTLQIGSLGYDNAWGVASDESSNLYVAGYFQDKIPLEGCGTLTSAGDSDALVVKLRR